MQLAGTHKCNRCFRCEITTDFSDLFNAIKKQRVNSPVTDVRAKPISPNMLLEYRLYIRLDSIPPIIMYGNVRENTFPKKCRYENLTS